MDLKSCTKVMNRVLSILDNGNLRLAIIVVLSLYAAMVSQSLDVRVTRVLSNPIVKIFVLVSIMCLAHKDMPVALLLTIAFVLSCCGNKRHLEHLEMPEKKKKDNEEVNEKESHINHEDPQNINANAHSDNSHGGDINVTNSDVNVHSDDLQKVEQIPVPNSEVNEESNNTPKLETFLNRSSSDILGYNSSVDCVKNCDSNGSLSSPCKGIGTFNNELNAQGLNCPIGNPGKDYASWD